MKILKCNFNSIDAIESMVLKDDELLVVNGGKSAVNCGKGCGVGCGDGCGAGCTGCNDQFTPV